MVRLEQRWRGGQLVIRLGPARRACAVLLLSASLGANAGAVAADEPAYVRRSLIDGQHRPADNAACAPAPQASQPDRKPLRAGWPEAQPDGIHVPKYNMQYDMEDYAAHATLAVTDGSKYSISKWHAADLAGGEDKNEMLCHDDHSAVSSGSCHALPAPRPNDGWGVDRGEARAARAQKRVVRVQRGESVGSEVSSGRANTDGESAASRPVRSGSPACLKHDPSRSAATLKLSSRWPLPESSPCDGVSPGIAHRSRTRLLEPLEQVDPCGWCKKPLNGSWLMVYDTMHCSKACLRATERSLDGTLWDYDATESFLREVTVLMRASHVIKNARFAPPQKRAP